MLWLPDANRIYSNDTDMFRFQYQLSVAFHNQIEHTSDKIGTYL